MSKSTSTPTNVSKIAIASFILGIISIPLFFLKLGSLAILLGIIALFLLRKPVVTGKWFAAVGIVTGIASVALAFIPFSTYFDVAFSPNSFVAQKSATSQQILDQDVKQIEAYKAKNGAYPGTLEMIVAIEHVPVFVFDHFLKEFYYKVSVDGQSYELRSIGPDGVCGTEDDILPTASQSQKIISCQVETMDTSASFSKPAFNPTGIIVTINAELRAAQGYDDTMAVLRKYDADLQPYYEQTAIVLETDFKAVNDYYEQNHNYPQSLQELSDAGYTIMRTDAFGGEILYDVAPYVDTVKTWSLVSDGPDGQYGSLDDMHISSRDPVAKKEHTL